MDATNLVGRGICCSSETNASEAILVAQAASQGGRAVFWAMKATADTSPQASVFPQKARQMRYAWL